MRPQEVARATEFRKCIECFLCQDVCHVVREHGGLARYIGPRFMVRVAALDAHPKDVLSRTDLLRGRGGIAHCDITGRCQEVCPDRVIFPLKERLGDDYMEPWRTILRRFGEVETPRDR
jgi:succinate dehydrogenase / fumarate reductase iron-sulfur subunit